MNLLVTGGAGFIGSHMVQMLLESGHRVVVADNLSTGHADAVPEDLLVKVSLSDHAALSALFASRRFDAVMHFASFIQVGESVQNPSKYYRNNLVNSLNLMDAMVAAGVNYLVFSSSAAIFGEPCHLPIDENHPRAPLNPYGHAKLAVEEMLGAYDHAYGLKSVRLRYFNAAGADPQSRMGERHDPETHLIPLVIQAAVGRRPVIEVFGQDYATADGTCIRDYVHVTDLCAAHLLALDGLVASNQSAAYNLGNGSGHSVLEVIRTVEKVVGRPVPITNTARRNGDPAILVSDSALARARLGWQPRFGDLQTIVAHAWQWYKTIWRCH